MKGTITEKILRQHMVDGEAVIGNEIAIKIDNTLTQVLWHICSLKL